MSSNADNEKNKSSSFFKDVFLRKLRWLLITVPASLFCLAERDFPRIKTLRRNDLLFKEVKKGEIQGRQKRSKKKIETEKKNRSTKV